MSRRRIRNQPWFWMRTTPVSLWVIGALTSLCLQRPIYQSSTREETNGYAKLPGTIDTSPMRRNSEKYRRKSKKKRTGLSRQRNHLDFNSLSWLQRTIQYLRTTGMQPRWTLDPLKWKRSIWNWWVKTFQRATMTSDPKEARDSELRWTTATVAWLSSPLVTNKPCNA